MPYNSEESWYLSRDDINVLLVSLDPYIRSQAYKGLPRGSMPATQWADTIDDLEQKVRIKLWEALCRGPVTNPYAYIRSIIHTEAVDLVRFYKRILPLILDDDGEPLLSVGTGQAFYEQKMEDPAEIFEQTEAVEERAKQIAIFMLGLPDCQRYALLTALKKRIGDILPLIEQLRVRGLDISWGSLPKLQEKGRETLCTSLCVARKKLRAFMDMPKRVHKRFVRRQVAGDCASKSLSA